MKHYIIISAIFFIPAIYMLYVGINSDSKMFYFGAGLNFIFGFMWIVLQKIKGKDWIVEKLMPFLRPL